LPTGTVAVTQSSGSNTTTIATPAFVQAAIALLYPVGSIYTNASVSTNPATLLGFGTWTAFAAGRVMVGFDAGNALFDTAEETGGSADAITVSHTHTATVSETPHSHTYDDVGRTAFAFGSTSGPDFNSTQTATSTTTATASTGITVSNSTTGSSGTNANYQPYITVYIWKRTA